MVVVRTHEAAWIGTGMRWQRVFLEEFSRVVRLTVDGVSLNELLVTLLCASIDCASIVSDT